MDLERLSITEIRERLGKLKGAVEEREYLTCKTIQGGVPRGVICEVTGGARTEWVLDVLIDNPTLCIFWAENALSILPSAMHQRGADLSRILIAETGDKLFQALRKALKSKLFDCVILPGAIDDVKMLKALQLFARESNAAVIFLSKNPKSAWAIPFQVKAEWAPGTKSYRVDVLKTKFSGAAAP